MREALFNESLSGSLMASGRAIDRVARAIRDRLSMDTWTVVSALAHELDDAERGGADERPIVLGARLDRVVMILAGLSGLTSESMTREAPWRFLDMGRRLERALNTALMIERTLPGATTADEMPLLEALLDAADSAMTYRRRYRATLQVAPVVDLLVADERNPRAIVFQLAALADHVASLPRDCRQRPPQHRRSGSPSRRSRRFAWSTSRRSARWRERQDRRVRCWGRCCVDLVHKLQGLSDALFAAYLTPATISRALALARRSAVIYRVKHITEYHYSVPVSTSHHDLHVLMRGSTRQRIRAESLTVDARGRRCAAIASTGSATARPTWRSTSATAT